MREKMQGMMGGGAVAVTKGATKKVAGYDCQDYDVTWARWDHARVRDDRDRAARAERRLPPLHLLRRPRRQPDVEEPGGRDEEDPGLHPRRVLLDEDDGPGGETSKEATEVKRGPIPPATFDVAAITKGYKKVASPTAQMGK